MKIKCFIFLFSLFLYSCADKEKNLLEQALSFAGDNRKELESVLQHYSNPKDSLKLKAAEFLIANMPGHYSYKNENIAQRYYDEVKDSVSINNTNVENKSAIEKISSKYNQSSFGYIWDSYIITAGFLIDNIEKAFDVWQNGEWATHVSFDDFCEYILPYKSTESQPLDDWRSYCLDTLKANLDTLHFCDRYKNSAFHAATVVSQEIINLNQQYYPDGGAKYIPVKSIKTLLSLPTASCDEYSALALAAMRSKGIPVMEDYTPQWPFQPQGHSWSVVLLNKGKNMIFSAGTSNPGELHNPDEKMAKVFRRTYAINRDILKLQSAESSIPDAFKSYFFKDVTDEYMATSDVEITVPNEYKTKHKYAYLAVFDNKNWIPVHHGKISGGKVMFDRMGRNCMYLPVVYSGNGVIPVSAPFYISATGKIKQLSVNNNKHQDITVYRKYFIAGHCYDVGHRMEGGLFQASNNSNFSDAVTLHTIPSFTVQSGEINLNDEGKEYRYWRYVSADGQFNNAAELYFYRNEGEDPLYGNIIGTEGSYTNQKHEERGAVFDNDPLTYFDAPQPSGTWAGLDFGEPVAIRRICYTPRGDGNDITPGDTHELLYWGKKGWVSLGKRQANDIKLIYENVPSETIYWIRNLSRGRDERIFTYEKGKQLWW